VLLDEISRSLGRLTAVIAVSGLFGFLHYPQGTMVPMALLSLVLAAVTLTSGSVLWAVALHVGWNGLAVVHGAPPGPGRLIIVSVTVCIVTALTVRGILTRHKTKGAR
jgi:membrane protease YdiL (CAAX protease family)